MNTQRFVLAGIAAFAAMMVFNFLWHGVLLEGQYMATMSLWRPQDQMGAYFPWAAGTTLLLGFVLAFLFTRHYEAKGIGEGARFGLYTGLIIGLMAFNSYPYIAIPLILGVGWFVGGLLQGIVAGVALSLVYKQ